MDNLNVFLYFFQLRLGCFNLPSLKSSVTNLTFGTKHSNQNKKADIYHLQ